MRILPFFKAIIPFFWSTDKRIRYLILLSAGFGLVTVIMNLSIPVCLRMILNLLSNHVHQPTVIAILIVASYGCIWTLAQLAQTLRFVVVFRPINRAVRRLSFTFFQHVMALPLSFHLEKKTGGLISNIEQAQSSLPSLIYILMWQLTPLIVEVTSAIVITCWLYGAIFGLMIFVTLTLYTLSTFYTVNQSIALQKDSFSMRKESSSYLHDSIQNYETIKYFNSEALESKQYDNALELTENARTRIDIRMHLITILQMIIVGIGITCITSYAALNIVNRHLTVGDFVLLNGYVLQFSVPMSYFGYLIRELKQSVFALQKTLEILATPASIVDQKNASLLATDKTDILFKGVKFSYANGREIIKDLSFSVPHGKTVAIVGPTGSGKSTLAKLLYRFYEVNDGTIAINQQAINTITLDSLRRAIGVVPQDAVLFHHSIRYNITYGNPNASEAELWQAIDMAGLRLFIDRLPMGLETLVGERGLKISGGEKQRVAIARMLLKKPSIFIFDEATSSLDVEMEQQIQQNIQMISQHITTIIIAHRLSTVVQADEIIVLQHGRIVEQGSHNQLIALRGYYFTMYQKQMGYDPNSKSLSLQSLVMK